MEGCGVGMRLTCCCASCSASFASLTGLRRPLLISAKFSYENGKGYEEYEYEKIEIDLVGILEGYG